MLSTLKDRMTELVRDEEGASLVEYVLMVALIAVVCIGAITLLGTSARDKFQTTAARIGQ
jgi:pilus assembly protein Flp/PilA